MKIRARGSDQFFEGLFTDLKPVFSWRHPSPQAWREYLAEQQASGHAQLDLEEALRWNDGRLQLHHHLLTCGRCARQVAALRQGTQPASERWLMWGVPRLVGYGALAALVIAVGLWMSIPHDGTIIATRPPIYGDISGGGVGGS